MPASLTTLAHPATSDLMISANAPGSALFGSRPALATAGTVVARYARPGMITRQEAHQAPADIREDFQ